MTNLITQTSDGGLSVPDSPIIPYVEGDGVGPEVTAAMQSVVNHAVQTVYGGRRSIVWKEVLAGGKAYERTGEWLPEETMQAFRHYLVGIKGPLTTPVGGGIRSLNVALRQGLDLFVCLRPVRWFEGVESPVKRPQDVDVTVFRENTEDIYAGIEWEAGTPEAEKLLRFLREEMGVSKVRFPESSSLGIKPISREGTERLVRAAAQYASAAAGLRSFTPLHSAVLSELCRRYPSEQLLTSVCRCLIRSDCRTEGAHAWYLEGVRRGVRLTGLYEYLIYSMSPESGEKLPHEVFLYFAYDNRLDDLSREKLYENLCRFRKIIMSDDRHLSRIHYRQKRQ